VPSDPELLAKVIGKKCTVKIAQKVLEMFEPVSKDPSRMFSPKLEVVRKEQEKLYKSRSERGKKGMANRWKKKASSDNTVNNTVIATDNQEQNRTEQNRKVEKELSNESSKKPKSAPPSPPSRIPKPFPITPEMYSWLAEEFPEGFDHKTAHENFIEYWTNESGTKALKLDWHLTWKRGMRLAKKWQDEDAQNAANGKNGRGKSNLQVSRERDYSKFEGLDPIAEFGTPKRG